MWKTNNRGRKINVEIQEMECNECGKLLPFSAFHESSVDSHPKNAKCKKCRSEADKKPKITKKIDGVVMYGYKDSTKPFYNYELEFKECNGCGKALHKSHFRKDKSGVFGVYSKCISCMAVRGTEDSKKYRKTAKGMVSKVKAAFLLAFSNNFPEIEKLPKIEEETLSLFVILAESEKEVAIALKDPNNNESRLLTAKMFGRVNKNTFNHYTRKYGK